MTRRSLLAAVGSTDGGAGMLVVVVVIGVLGWVVARSMQRQRDYERRLRDQPDGVHGGRPDVVHPEPGSGVDEA